MTDEYLPRRIPKLRLAENPEREEAEHWEAGRHLLNSFLEHGVRPSGDWDEAVPCEASTAVVFHRRDGDVGGNSQRTVIEVASDGGQFPLSKVERTPTGFRVEILGTWEAAEFLAACASLLERHHTCGHEGAE